MLLMLLNDKTVCCSLNLNVWVSNLTKCLLIHIYRARCSTLDNCQNSLNECVLFYLFVYWDVGLFLIKASLWEEAMAPHSSTLAWKIPWMDGGLQSMGSRRVGHDWVTSLSFFTFMHWRRKWQLTPVFLPGESQGRGSLVGCRLWGRTDSDTTEAT